MPAIRFGFSAEVEEQGVPVYALGARMYLPSHRMFLSPDGASPFAAGGIHRYAYCAGDPVNRVDPHGESFFDWLLSGAGLVGALVGLAGAIAAIPTGGASLAATAALWGGGALETASVAAEVGSVVANATGESELGGVLGWVALGTGLAAGGLGAIASRTAKNISAAARRSVNRVAGADDVLPAVANEGVIYRGAEVPGSRVRTVPIGERSELRVVPEWHRFEDARRVPGAVHWAADSAVSLRDAVEALPGIVTGRARDERVYFYTGAHGRVTGDNWGLGVRNLTDMTLLGTTERNASRIEDAIGQRPLSIVDMAAYDTYSIAWQWKRAGIHVHDYCFGAVDKELIKLFNVSPTPVYRR